MVGLLKKLDNEEGYSISLWKDREKMSYVGQVKSKKIPIEDVIGKSTTHPLINVTPGERSEDNWWSVWLEKLEREL